LYRPCKPGRSLLMARFLCLTRIISSTNWTPTGLTPLAQSDLLDLGAVSIKTPAHLVADENHLFVGSQAISQTLVLNRDDFTPVTTSTFSTLTLCSPIKLQLSPSHPTLLRITLS